MVWVGDTHWQLLHIGDLESSGNEERGRGKEEGLPCDSDKLHFVTDSVFSF